jgi:hypothetical protein
MDLTSHVLGDLHLDTGADVPTDFPLAASTTPLSAADTHTHWSTCRSKMSFKISIDLAEEQIPK